MGSSESAQEKKHILSGPSKINHPRFSQFVNSYNSHHEPCFEVRIPISSKKNYDDWENALGHAPHDHDNFLMPHQIHLHQQGFCGSAHYINAFFDKYPYILFDQIKSRSQVGDKGYFTEPELWFLINTLVASAHDFHVRGLKVGDIRPQNVFINHQGRIKIPTFLSWPDQKVNYEKMFYDKQITYLAPQQINDLKLVKQSSSCDKSLAESFSVGLTCLAAAILKSCEGLYLKNNCFDYHELSLKLSQLKSKNYSQDFIKIITDLCNPEASSRSTCSEIFKLLSPYEKQINNFQKFQIKALEKIKSYQTKLPIRMSVNNPQRQTSMNVNGQKNQTKSYFLSSSKNASAQKQTEKSTPYKSRYSYKNEQFKNQKIYQQRPLYQRYSKQQSISSKSNREYKKKYQYDIPQSQYAKHRQSAQQTLSKIDQQLAWSKKMFPK